MENIKEGIQAVGENLQGKNSEAKSNANVSAAQNSNNSMGTRAVAAKDAVVNKTDQIKHNVNEEQHKQKAVH